MMYRHCSLLSDLLHEVFKRGLVRRTASKRQSYMYVLGKSELLIGEVSDEI